MRLRNNIVSNREEFGANLRAAIEARDMNQKQFAARIMVSTTHLNMILQGHRSPSFQMILLILNEFPSSWWNDLFLK